MTPAADAHRLPIITVEQPPAREFAYSSQQQHLKDFTIYTLIIVIPKHDIAKRDHGV